MVEFLHSIGLLGVVGIFVFGVLGMIFLLRYLLKMNGAKDMANKDYSDPLVKKVPSADINKYRPLIRNTGMIFSLALVLAAFEFPDYDEAELVDLGQLDDIAEEMMEVPPTEQKPPPPPKVQAPEIVEVPDEEEIEQEIEVDLDMEADEETIIQEVEVLVEEEPEEEETADQVFEIVEEGATPKGGIPQFLQWVGKNIKYPAQAKRMGVEGKVYVQFVVDTDGSLTDVKVIRGIGGGCDEEAVRIFEKAKKWSPGKQRGRAVKQRIVLPINFRLAK